jgi:hypothetical protein
MTSKHFSDVVASVCAIALVIIGVIAALVEVVR